MTKTPFSPYRSSTLKRYFGFLYAIMILLSIFLVVGWNVAHTRAVLPHLGRVMGGAFTFIFGIGIHLARTSGDIRPRLMPLFPNTILYYILVFIFSTIFPFIISSLELSDGLLAIFFILSFNLSFFCLALIPLVYGIIQTRFYPINVLNFLKNNAIGSIENTNDYTESWQNIIDIVRICLKISQDNVDLFAGGIRRIIAILNTGIQRYENVQTVLLNGRNLSVREWTRLCKTRILWIGEKVVADRYAFERVIVAILYHITSTDDIFEMCQYLLSYARAKDHIDSLNIGIINIRQWCEANNLNDRCDELLRV